jgi:hypothetical protein
MTEIFHGHLGNLTESQELLLQSFKSHRTSSKAYTTSHDDPTLLYVPPTTYLP